LVGVAEEFLAVSCQFLAGKEKELDDGWFFSGI
jgi:hypothetical protein